MQTIFSIQSCFKIKYIRSLCHLSACDILKDYVRSAVCSCWVPQRLKSFEANCCSDRWCIHLTNFKWNHSQGASLASPPRIFQTPSLNTPVSTLCHSAERKKNPSHYLNTRLQPMGGTHGTNKSDSWTGIDSNFEFTSRFEDCSHIMKSKKYIFENGSDW